MPMYLQMAYDLLRSGQVGDAISYVVHGAVGLAYAMFPMLPILRVPGAMAQNFANVVNQLVPAVMGVGLSAVVAITNPIHAFGQQAQAFVDSVKQRRQRQAQRQWR